MRNILFSARSGRVERFITSILEIDIDENAELFFVLDETRCRTVAYGVRPPSGIAKVILPIPFATSNILTVGILDKDGAYNVRAVSGAKTRLINMYDVDLSQ